MTIQSKRSIRNGRGLLSGYFRSEAGNFAAIMAVLLIPLAGALGMGVEASNWFLLGRATQNAADSAALAAANNGATTTKSGASAAEYVLEGQAGAAQYGFINGSNNATVTVTTTSAGDACPDGATTTCFKATVTKVVPIYLTAVAGFTGDTTIGAARAKTITSVAYAEPLNAISFPTCLWAEGSDANSPAKNQPAISGSGTPTANAPGCSIAAVGSSSSISCTGSNGLGAPFGFATGGINPSNKNDPCFTSQSASNSNFVFCDPYSATVNTGCTVGTTAGYISTAVGNASGTPCVKSPIGADTLSAITASCTYSTNNGVLSLGADLNPSTPMVIVVSGNGATVNMGTHSSNNITWIFTGSAANPAEFASGTSINITAPNATSGSNLQGIAAYQDISSTCTRSGKNVTCGTWTENGNQTVQVTGLFYMPYTNASFGGNVSESSTGNCLIAGFNSFADNGTGLLLDEAGCKAAGLGTVPTVTRYRAALVQ